MAKKVVATLKDLSNTKNFVKVVRAIKSPETGAYSFKEDMVPQDLVKDFINNKLDDKLD